VTHLSASDLLYKSIYLLTYYSDQKVILILPYHAEWHRSWKHCSEHVQPLPEAVNYNGFVIHTHSCLWWDLTPLWPADCNTKDI